MSILPGEKAHAATQQFLASIQAADPKKRRAPLTSSASTSTPQRQGDRGNADEPDNADDLGKLPIFVKFKDIQRAGIANNWPTLLRLIKQQNFPQGVWLGANSRAWEVSSILAWIKDRPSALKTVSPRRKHQQLDQNAETPAG